MNSKIVFSTKWFNVIEKYNAEIGEEPFYGLHTLDYVSIIAITLKDEILLVKQFIADIENINVAEAITRLNNDQTALEASFKVFSQLNSLSLLNFI